MRDFEKFKLSDNPQVEHNPSNAIQLYPASSYVDGYEVEQKQILTKEIVFFNKRRASVLTASFKVDAADIVQALDIGQPEAVIMVIGGAKNMKLDDQQQSYLSALFSHGIALAARDSNAVIVDGGTTTGVMKLIGQGVAECEHTSVLLGVCPANKVTYPGGPADGSIEDGSILDPNHSHFVLVEDSGWGGDTTKTMHRLVKALSVDSPVVVIIAGGGLICQQEVLQTVRYGWPMIIIEGSTGEADRMANLWHNKESFLEDSSFTENHSADAEILSQGKLQTFPITGSSNELKDLIFRQYQK